jgi:hypothetical protein
LQTFSLRPQEWFRLAALHGWPSYLLHDDLYDDDGTATAPEVAVVDASAHPFPSAMDWNQSVPLALDVAYAKWWLPTELIPVLSADPIATLNAIRTTTDTRRHPQIVSRAYEVCAKCLAASAADWILAEWQRPKRNEVLLSLSQASAACLPAPVGLDLVATALRQLAPDALRESVACLSWFLEPKALDLLEEFVAPPLTETWGRAAACCGLDWNRVSAWLTGGRPLSLVALDALAACLRYDTILLRDLRPRLYRPPQRSVLVRELMRCRDADPTPRVKRVVGFVLDNVDALLAGGGSPTGQ